MFEFFFKYPRSAYSLGKIALLGAWPAWVLIVLIAAACAALAFLIRSQFKEAAPNMRGWRAWTIWGLQSLMAAIVLTLLWQPALTVSELRKQQNIIAVLVDDSRSMGITEDGSTRQAQAVKALGGDLLPALQKQFQTRLYKVDDRAARIEDLKELHPDAGATRLSDSLKNLSDETSDLPIGAVILASDGDDNSGGINADTIAALRARHIPVHTVGFGREHAQHDVEIDDVSVAPRALAESRLAAKITLHQRGYTGSKVNLTVKDVTSGAGKLLAARTVTLGPEGNLQTETVMFDVGGAGAKTLEIAAAPLPGEESTKNNALSRLVNVTADTRRVLYVEGEPRWEYKFIREAEEDDRMVKIASMVRTSENKTYRQGITDSKELADGFPSKPEDLFGYQGLIIGSVESGYFSLPQQELIREFVDRRGGGLLLLGGQFALADGGWNSSTLTDLLPTILPERPGTFHREEDPLRGTQHTTVELAPDGADSIVTRLVDDPAANAAKWKNLPYLMDYEDPGTPKPGAQVLVNMIPAGATRPIPLLITQKFGHGRTAIMATGGSWRWQMSSPLGDTAYDLFWQQLLRWLISDTPGHVAASVPQQVLLDNGSVTLTADIRDQQYNPAPDAKVQANILGPNVTAQLDMTPIPDNPGQFQAVWSAPKEGDYLAEITASRTDASTGKKQDLGRDTLSFQRRDGVAENFHTEQNRELLEHLADQTGGKYWKPSDLSGLAKSIPYSEAGVTMRDTKDLWDLPIVFLALIALRFAEWWLRRKWGIV